MKKYNKVIRYWLILGCVLLFFQIIIGGITRITGSGLSITKWEIVTGAIPPLNQHDWTEAFDLYKETPQYEKINDGMSLSDFKFIYFWEFFHRLWARIMGFIFLIPLLFFVSKKYIDKPMLKILSAVFICAMLAAVFGWIMVASGLNERPWVNAYKLSIHLSIALATMAFLLWATFRSFNLSYESIIVPYRKLFLSFFILLCFQLILGGIMSGTKASMVFPTWPQIGDNMVPSQFFQRSNWTIDNFVNYDKNGFALSVFHFLHRGLGYIVFGLGVFMSLKCLKLDGLGNYRLSSGVLIVLLFTQVGLGILTLLQSVGSIPVLWGVLHQAVAILIFSVALFLLYISGKETSA